MIVLLFSSNFAFSAANLYEARVKVVADKGENELIADAFTQVLIKVSGRSDIPASPAYKNMLQQAKAAISQFRYDIKTIQPDELSATMATDPKALKEVKEKWFWVRFNAITINRLLQGAQLPVWGKTRPESLIWFSQDNNGQRRLLSQYDVPEVYDAFQQQADYRGISLIFPFLDLQDQSSVSATDIWGNFNDAVLLASRRYQAQSTVTVRLFQERSGLWVSQWSLLMLGAVQSWEVRDEEMTRVLASGIDEVADRLAKQFSQVAGEGDESGILIRVNNVSDFKAFQELDDYLRNLATVKSAALVQTSQDKVIYNIHYRGDKKALIQEIRLGDLLNSIERTRLDYGAQDTGSKDYQAVILDDLGNTAGDRSAGKTTASARGQALDAMKADPSGKQSPSAQQSAKSTSQPSVEKTVEPLMPELEYWLTI